MEDQPTEAPATTADTVETIAEKFTPDLPSPKTDPYAYSRVRHRFVELAEQVLHDVPAGESRDAAIASLQEAFGKACKAFAQEPEAKKD